MKTLWLLLFFPCALLAQPITPTVQTQKIDKKNFLLTNKHGKVRFTTWTSNENDTTEIKIAHDLQSTGNPIQHIGFQFISEQVGFIYGNEMGYGTWPFFLKKIDGGKSWERLLFKKREYGVPILPKYFHMFDDKRGILIYNYKRAPNSFIRDTERRLRYYITKDGGKTWKSRSQKIKSNVRISNEEYRLTCDNGNNGKVRLRILIAPWEAVSGKRSIEDRTILELISDNYGKSFEEILQ